MPFDPPRDLTNTGAGPAQQVEVLGQQADSWVHPIDVVGVAHDAFRSAELHR